MAFNQFPYSNFHEINADWMLQQIKSDADRVEAALAVIDGVESQITALQNADAQLRQELTAISASLSQMGTVVSRHTSEITALQQADVSLEGDLQDIRTELINTEQRLGDVEVAVYRGLWPALAEPYTVGNSYTVGSIVYENNALWRCVTAHTGGLPFDPTKWEQVTMVELLDMLSSEIDDKMNVVNPTGSGLLKMTADDGIPAIELDIDEGDSINLVPAADASGRFTLGITGRSTGLPHSRSVGIVGLLDPVSDTGAATKHYVDSAPSAYIARRAYAQNIPATTQNARAISITNGEVYFEIVNTYNRGFAISANNIHSMTTNISTFVPTADMLQSIDVLCGAKTLNILPFSTIDGGSNARFGIALYSVSGDTVTYVNNFSSTAADKYSSVTIDYTGATHFCFFVFSAPSTSGSTTFAIEFLP